MHTYSPEQFDITSLVLDLHRTEVEDDFETYEDVYNFTQQ